MVCLRLVIMHNTELSFVGGSKNVVKLLKEAIKIEPEESLYCLALIW